MKTYFSKRADFKCVECYLFFPNDFYLIFCITFIAIPKNSLAQSIQFCTRYVCNESTFQIQISPATIFDISKTKWRTYWTDKKNFMFFFVLSPYLFFYFRILMANNLRKITIYSSQTKFWKSLFWGSCSALVIITFLQEIRSEQVQ